jgi:mono/diheme cytochrome c family protein
MAFASAPVTYARATGVASGPTGAPTKLQTGKGLYRKYCGQCHALTAALAAGFGSNIRLGTNGGPSFDSLRISVNLSILAVTQPFIGHEVLAHKMTWAQIKTVSSFVATVTKHHSVLAQPVDG